MDRFALIIRALLADERGATAIEYCLIGGFISIAIVAGATQIGQAVLRMFQSANAGFQ